MSNYIISSPTNNIFAIPKEYSALDSDMWRCKLLFHDSAIGEKWKPLLGKKIRHQRHPFFSIHHEITIIYQMMAANHHSYHNSPYLGTYKCQVPSQGQKRVHRLHWFQRTVDRRTEWRDEVTEKRKFDKQNWCVSPLIKERLGFVGL